ncbi:MAG: hypothetical protein SFV18_12155 [Bryobacteraceae bacterium]|nr:hypothetical protein [Bryobacteraceae bacterium]
MFKATPCLLVLLFLSAKCQGEKPNTPCFIDVPVYDPFGERLPFRVVRVSPENAKHMNLLRTRIDGIQVTSIGSRVVFPAKPILGAEVKTTLEDAKKRRLTTRFVVTDCHMRRSQVYRSSDNGFDVSSIPVKGRLSGCRFTGDWWVRVLPMFGGPDHVIAADGYVHENGALELAVETLGVRRILIVGKGKEALRTIAFNTTSGKNSDVGMIDLRGACPP